MDRQTGYEIKNQDIFFLDLFDEYNGRIQKFELENHGLKLH